MKEQIKDLEYWKNNAEEDYLITPISVLAYISELEENVFFKNQSLDFIKTLIQKEEVLKLKLSENMDLYKSKNLMIKYDNTFSQWNKSGLVIWDLKDILCRMGVEID